MNETTPAAYPGPLLARMTWPEVEAARSAAPLVIIPTGACEQHGHHMALETDTVRGAHVAHLLAERLAPRAVVTPALNIGVSGHHLGFPGTLSLQPATFQALLGDVVRSVYHHGWRHIFILNGHGGNNTSTGVLVNQFQRELPDLRMAWSGITSVVPDLAQELAAGPGAAHSSEIETSQSLHIDPDLVREDLLAAHPEPPERYGRLATPAGVHVPVPFDRISADGSTGRPSAASREAGEKLVSAVVDRLGQFLERFIDDSATTRRNPS